MKPSPTLAMAAKARELSAAGKDVISLTVGEPDWPTSQAASLAAKAAIDKGFTKYTAAAGIIELRKKIAENLSKELRLKISEQQVVVGSGAKFVIYAALQMLINPGDEVLIPAPYWVSYPTMVELAGGRAQIVTCDESVNFKLTADVLRSNISSQTKALILCSPSNPTGIVYSEKELEGIAQVLRDFPQLIIISDDIYNRLMFSEVLTAPHLLHVAPDLQNRLIAVNGASKTFSMTGWRVGWASCPVDFAKVMSDYFSQTTSNVSSVSQYAVLQALHESDSEANHARKILRKRWDFFTRGLSHIEGLKVCSADGAFYVWLNCQKWFGKTYQPTGQKIINSSHLADLLLEQAFLATVPGVEFGLEGYLRLSFAASDELLNKALIRIQDFSRKLI